MRLLLMGICCCLIPCYALGLNQGELALQLGYFSTSPGQEQHINIDDLIGNQYTTSDSRTDNALVGAGYYLPLLHKQSFDLSYGINGFYLGKDTVSGVIIQENIFSNLSYQYHIQHVPVYMAARAKLYWGNSPFAAILDGGLGLDFMKTSHYLETSLDGVTLPDNAFFGQSDVVLSANLGIGLRVDKTAFGTFPLECGYRLFYFNPSNFNSSNPAFLNRLSTGKNYANALICSVSI